MIQIAGTEHFINKLTRERLSEVQLKNACVYLRAKGISFYDEFSKEHCLFITQDNKQKNIILSALQYSLIKVN